MQIYTGKMVRNMADENLMRIIEVKHFNVGNKEKQYERAILKAGCRNMEI